MKVLILAAGSREHQLAQQTTDTWVLQSLGDHEINVGSLQLPEGLDEGTSLCRRRIHSARFSGNHGT